MRKERVMVDYELSRKIVDEYARVRNYSRVAKKYGVSPNTVKNHVERYASEIEEEGQGSTAQRLVEMCMIAMMDEEKLKSTPMNQLSSALKTVSELFMKDREGEGMPDGELAERIARAWDGEEETP
jgi:transposase-like protein